MPKQVFKTHVIIIIIIMAQQRYMGSVLLFSEVTGSCAFVAVGDWACCCSIDPDVTARAIWQAVRRLG
jgi:hypothetical protein